MAEEQKDQNPMDNFMEHQRKAMTETRKALESLLPEAFREHGAAAVNESLEGYRKLFNTMLDEVKGNYDRAMGTVKSRFQSAKEEAAETAEEVQEEAAEVAETAAKKVKKTAKKAEEAADEAAE